MANNRMYLKCSLCGDKFYLGKYFISTGWYQGRAGSHGFGKFLDAHSPFPRRGGDGKYSALAEHVPHGNPTHDQKLGGKTFELVYE